MSHHIASENKDHPHEHHQRFGDQDQHRGLDLDAEVFSEHLTAVLNLTGPEAHTIVDLGAGTGAGSRLLRERYPDAVITCVDNNRQMLELLREQDFTVIEADLDEGFPALPETPVDLIWASSSLHHVADPARLLSGAHRALAPNGSLVIVELTTLPSFLINPREVLLEQRCHRAAAAEGWNHYPDWTSVIEDAGLIVAKSEVTTTAPVTPAAREYAQQWFARFSHLAGLSTSDRHAVEDLLKRFSNNLELEPRTTRTVWVATSTRTGNNHESTHHQREPA
ncbi:ubiquinone/menaquinone biosynthesis C-methylase UbiE [Arthrobacter sp. CAN_A214]|uniref:class I SAM-dependent methyltransferase n=1 Tax=Arthrobacter sp. CAN_A214 TaxID=2787720 RepID=UPI0018C9CE2B